MRANLAGIGPSLPSFAGIDFDRFLAGLKPAASIEARHTVVTPLRPRRSPPDDQYSSESNVSKTS
jgi:hypothetical protein